MSGNDASSDTASNVNARRPRLTWLRAVPEGAGETGARRALTVGRLVVGALSLVMLGLVGRTAYLQSNPDPRVTTMLDAHTSAEPILARRGAIQDRRGRVLAATRIRRRLFADPQLIEQRGTFAERVGYNLGYEPARISRLLHGQARRRYVVLDQRMSPAQSARARALNLRGLASEPVQVRDYPHGALAGQLIGFVGRDGEGLAGLEARFEPTLAPEPGQVRYLRDARRRALWAQGGSYEAPKNGKPVRLALDINIQSYAEQALGRAVEKYGAAHGEVVVMNPHTGEVLAMANYPRFDPNHFQRTTAAQRRNRCVTDSFEPGSIFKPFIWSIATQLDVARPTEKIDTTEAGFYVTEGGRQLHDTHGHGRITWNNVLVLSSNIGMAKVGQRLGIDRMHRAVRAFGFGQPTGAQLPGEVGGLVRPARKWNHYSITSIPMGQEIGVTALQVTRAFCAFANGGLLVTPTVRAATQPEVVPIQQRVLRRDVADRTRRVLRRVVTEGTGRRARSEQYAIFGKTGTAQMPNLKEGGYYDERYVASFIGGAPVEAPRVVVGCFVHDPDKDKGHYGGTVSGPVVKQVLERSLRYLGAAPGGDASTAAQAAATR